MTTPNGEPILIPRKEPKPEPRPKPQPKPRGFREITRLVISRRDMIVSRRLMDEMTFTGPDDLRQIARF